MKCEKCDHELFLTGHCGIGNCGMFVYQCACPGLVYKPDEANLPDVFHACCGGRLDWYSFVQYAGFQAPQYECSRCGKRLEAANDWDYMFSIPESGHYKRCQEAESV